MTQDNIIYRNFVLETKQEDVPSNQFNNILGDKKIQSLMYNFTDGINQEIHENLPLWLGKQ